MFGPSPNDLMVCAMNSAEYDTAAVCGASIHVVGPQGETTVRIVDLCPECPKGNVDLSKQAFSLIADTILGRVAISWRYVSTQVTGPVEYRIKTGSNPWWIGIQVLNHRNPIVKLEALVNGAWIQVPRTSYNYFVYAAGLGAGPFSFRSTDLYGQQLVDSNIPLEPDSVVAGAANFSTHSSAVAFDPARRRVQKGFFSALWTKTESRSAWRGPEYFAADVYKIDGVFVGQFSQSSLANARIPAGVYLLKPRVSPPR